MGGSRCIDCRPSLHERKHLALARLPHSLVQRLLKLVRTHAQLLQVRIQLCQGALLVRATLRSVRTSRVDRLACPRGIAVALLRNMRRQLPRILKRVPHRFVEDVVRLGVPIAGAHERFGDDFGGGRRGRFHGSVAGGRAARCGKGRVVAGMRRYPDGRVEKSQEARYAQQDCRQEPDLLAQVPQSFLEPSRRLRGAVPPGLASLALRRPLAELVFWTGARNSCRLARNLERGG
ncbi:hypothetical protein BJY59DRAFT_702752 [Rhodotorula toruloides]